MSLRTWLKGAGGLVFGGLLVFVFGWAPYYLGGIATTRRFQFPDKENAGLDPAALGLAYEDVALRASDGVDLSGWWVPAARPRGTVVLVHGLNRSRVEMVRKAPFVNQHGWNALLLDLRHHGKSGGDVTTFGLKERQDVLAAVAEARRRSPGPVVLWGVSLGGASVVLAAAQDPSISGVVCDSSYRSLPDTVRHHLGLFRSFRWWLKVVPPWPLADQVLFWMGRRGGFDPAEVDVRAAAARLRGRPALFVANSDDRRMPSEIAFDLQKAAGGPAEVLVVPGKSHGGAWRDGTAAYSTAVAGLLEAAEAGAGAMRVAAR
ncbi:MAG TPA: alpha/beta fold hydrolase [Vicinamibacteria bacterium]|nr:alpha/beta fold hydrolase [Vicinamibacteria bacterium]